MDFIAWLEQNGFGVWMRESPSLLAWPTVIVLHTVGLAFLVGSSVAIDLRILGVAPRMVLAPMERFFFVAWLGFWVNAASGVALLVAFPRQEFTHPFFYIKMACVGLGIACIPLLKKQVFRDPSLDEGPIPMKGKVLAVASIVFWLGAITAGRYLAYTLGAHGESNY